MNDIIQRLSEVEAAASSVMEEAAARKKYMAKSHADRVAAFEKQAHEETEREIRKQQSLLESRIAQELKEQKEELEQQLYRMDQVYEQRHTAIAKQLLDHIAAQ